MKRLKSPARRPNDGHVFQSASLAPLSRTLRKVADLVLHDRVVKPKTGRGSGQKTGKAQFASRRFSEAEIIAMRLRYRNGERNCDLAREFGLHPNAMAMLLKGESYAWVRDDLVAA